MSQNLTGTIYMSYIKYADGSLIASFTTDLDGVPWNTGQTGQVSGEDHFHQQTYIPLSNIKGIILNDTNKPVTVTYTKTDTNSTALTYPIVYSAYELRLVSSYRVTSPGGTSSHHFIHRYRIDVTGYWE